MKILLLMTIVALIFATISFPQSPDLLWAKNYGTADQEIAYSVCQTDDNGFVMTGLTRPNVQDADLLIVRTDSNGDSLWSKFYGSSEDDVGRSILQTQDGGFVIAGYKYTDVWLLKTDSSGDTLWTKTYGGSDADRGYAAQITSDGGFIIVGSTRSFGSGSFDFFLIKTDSSGDTVWTKSYGGSNDERAYSVMQTSDDGYIIVGETTSFGSGNDDVWMVRTDSFGDTLWTKSFGGAESDEGHSVIQASDGGFVIAGVKESLVTYDDMWLIKTNSSGEMLWEKTYDYGVGDNEEGNSVVQTSDGGFAICGIGTNIVGFSEDILIIRTDELGDTLWTIAYGDSSYDVGNSIIQSSDGGYIIAGAEESFVNGVNFLLMKIDSDLLPSVDEKFIPSEFSLSQNYPNPFNPSTKIKYQIPEMSFVTLKVYDVLGNEVATLVNKEKPAGEYEVEFNASKLPSGIYFYQIKAGEFIQTKKMIFIK